MGWIRSLGARFQALFRKDRLDTQMDEELAFHLEMEAEKNLRLGMSPEDARRQALIAFGGVERTKEEVRAERGIRFWENLARDFCYAVRQLRRSPGFALTAILTLALGIGATTVVFSVFNAVVLQPLPFENPEELVRIREVTPQGQTMSVSDPNFLDFRAQSSAFQEMVAVSLRPMVLQDGEAPTRINAMAVTQGFFQMLRISPVLGGGFQPAHHDILGEAKVVMISHGLWERRFGADPGVMGRTFLMDGVPREVVGVLPETLGDPFGFDAWLPFSADPGFPRDDHRREVFARLDPGTSLETAQGDLSTIQARLGQEYPQSNGGYGVSVVTFREWVVGPQATRIAQVLLVAVGLLLFLACASVSNLLVTRATSRQREMSLRAALGAGRRRLLSQLLAESLVLSLVGGVSGLLLTYWALPVIRALPSSPLPRLGNVSLDRTVLFFALGMTLLSTAIFGLAPALQGTRLNLMDSLKTGGRLVTLQARRLRDGLVIGQLALATMLLVGAGLLATSLVRMMAVDPGFDTEQTLLVELSVPLDQYPEMSPQTGNVYAEILEAIEAVPGVTEAGATMASPISDNRPSNFLALPEEASGQDGFLQVGFRPVTPGFFEAMGIPLLAGRIFDDRDAQAVMASAETGEEAQVPLVLSSSLAEGLWPLDEAVGKTVIWGAPGGPEMLVIGVVDDVRDLSFPQDPGPMAYLPHRLVAWPTMTLVVRSAVDPSTIAGLVREAVWSVNPGIPVPELRLVGETLDRAMAGPRLNATLMGVFSLAALLLAAVGLYGLTAFSVARRSREIGVRMALGASKPSVMALVLRRGMGLVVWGVVLGMVCALLLGRFLESILFGVEADHLLTHLQAGVALGLVTLVASILPARRALRVDPVRSIQAD